MQNEFVGDQNVPGQSCDSEQGVLHPEIKSRCEAAFD